VPLVGVVSWNAPVPSGRRPHERPAGTALAANVVASTSTPPGVATWNSSPAVPLSLNGTCTPPVTFADEGGAYDHVPPPAACAPDGAAPALAPGDAPGTFAQLGFRAPLFVISPWARAGYVGHATYDHTSIARFIETRFELGALGARDANADPLLDLFDVSAAHAQPFPTPGWEIDVAGFHACDPAGPD
jgi:Phosphoesterase family